MTKALPDHLKTRRRRPSLYSERLARHICGRLTEGVTLTKICSSDRMPSRQAVYRWMEDRPEFFDMYMRARQQQALYWADELIDIADSFEGDVSVTEDGNVYTNHHVIQRDKLRVDTRFNMLEKVLPRVFGRQAPIQHKQEHGKVEVQLVQISQTPVEKPDNIPQFTVDRLKQLSTERRKTNGSGNGQDKDAADDDI